MSMYCFIPFRPKLYRRKLIYAIRDGDQSNPCWGMQSTLGQRSCSVSGSECHFGNPTQHSIPKNLVAVFTNYIINKISREPYGVQSTVPATCEGFQQHIIHGAVMWGKMGNRELWPYVRMCESRPICTSLSISSLGYN